MQSFNKRTIHYSISLGNGIKGSKKQSKVRQLTKNEALTPNFNERVVAPISGEPIGRQHSKSHDNERPIGGLEA